jgi:lipopolysaccharide heptosyltransferase I
VNGPSLRAKQFDCILLIKPSALGDVIHTIPVLVKLRARYPAARIDWLLRPDIADLIRHHPALSNVVPFERNSYLEFGRSWASTKAVFHLLTTLRRNRYDLVVDLHGQLRSALLTLVTGAGTRIGFDRPRKGSQEAYRQRIGRDACLHGWTGAREGAWIAYSHRIPIPTLDVHAVDRYLWVARLLGLDDGPADMRLSLPPQAVANMTALLHESGISGKRYAVLVPGTIWETKHWRIEGFAEVGRHLRARGLEVVLAGSPAERSRCRAVAEGCLGAHDLCGRTTLTELAALIREAECCVTNDSGSMHLTVALDRPVVSIFGPTDPVWIGPYGRADAVAQASLPCAPCYLKKLSGCPHNHACMEKVTASMVIERLNRILGGTSVAA